MKLDTDKLVDAQQLLEILWSPETRPCLRWIRVQCKNRTIPYFKIGRLVVFDPEKVRASLERKNIIRER